MSLKSFLKKSRIVIALKGIYQTVSIQAKLAYYRLFAPEIDDFALAAEKLQQRGVNWLPGKPIKVFAVFSINNWEISLVKALETIGPVTHFNWPPIYDFFDRKSEWIKHRDKLNIAMLDSFEAMYEPDVNTLVFLYTSDFIITSETLALLKRSNVIVVNFCWDDLLYFKAEVRGQAVGVDQVSRKVDWNLTLSPEAISRYHFHKSACFFWEAIPSKKVESNSIPLLPVNNNDTEFYVLFIGSRYGWRGDFIDKLRLRGVNVKCFGYGWENGSIETERMEAEIRSASLTLGFANVGYTKNVTTIKGRDFEVPALGGLYLTQYAEGLEKYYASGKEILTYRSFDTCYQMICLVQNDKMFADTVRNAGYQKAIHYCSWDARMQYLYALINKITNV